MAGPTLGPGDGGLGDDGPENTQPTRDDYPPRNGYNPGDRIRHRGFVYEWQPPMPPRTEGTWKFVRPTDAKARENLPTFTDYYDQASSNPPGTAGERPAGTRTGQPSGNTPDSSPGSGGGGGRNRGGRGAGGGGGGRGDKDELRGIPDGAQIINVEGTYYAVYDGPKGDVRLGYAFRNAAEARAITAGKGIAVDRTMSEKEFRRSGIIKSGPADLIVNQSEHPWDRFRQDFKRETRFKPWLKDPDFMALIAKSILEGRSPSLSEVQSTEWYQTHSGLERQQLELYYGDRETWKANRVSAERKVEDALAAAGYTGAGRERLENYLSREMMFGRLPAEDLTDAVEQLTNPLADNAARTAGLERPDKGKAVEIDGEIFWRAKRGDKRVDYRLNDAEEAMFGGGAVERNRVLGGGGEGVGKFGQFARRQDDDGRDFRGRVDGMEQVDSLLQRYVGPALASGFSERERAQWAQRISENPSAADEFVTRLQKIRAAKYKGYDPELTYEDIAAVGRSQVMDVWGRRMNEKSPLFQRILQENDAEKASQLLWKEGLDRGVERVTQQALSQLNEQMQGGIQRSAV